MIIRHETYQDIEAITHVTIEAFRNHPISRQTEQFIVTALRDAGVLALSLVAEVDGHVAFSPVTVSDGSTNWYGVGPLSVMPSHQKQGVGKALMHEGLSLLKAMGGKGCALVGDPAYYKRFGFRNIPDLIHDGVPPEVFLVLPFYETIPRGTVVFHKGFWATA